MMNFGMNNLITSNDIDENGKIVNKTLEATEDDEDDEDYDDDEDDGDEG